LHWEHHDGGAVETGKEVAYMFEIARTTGESTKLTAGGLLLAVLAIVPGVMTACFSGFEYYQVKKPTLALEVAKLNLEERKVAGEEFQAALANSDPHKRQQLLLFLIDVGVIKDENNRIRNLTPEQIPQSTPTASPSGP
jgi:hypothetical protein